MLKIFVFIFVVDAVLCIYNREELTTKPPYTTKNWRKLAIQPEDLNTKHRDYENAQVTLHHNYSRVHTNGPNSNHGYTGDRTPVQTVVITETKQTKTYTYPPQSNQENFEPDVEPIWSQPQKIQEETVNHNWEDQTIVNQKLNWEQTETNNQQKIEEQSGTNWAQTPVNNKLDWEQEDTNLRRPKGHYIVREQTGTKGSSEIKVQDKLMRIEQTDTGTKRQNYETFPQYSGSDPTYKLEYRPKEHTYSIDTKRYSNMAFENCPENSTGPVAYIWSCAQFLNCWKGRGFVQNCAAGTYFNPETLECDYPHKVNCISGPHNQKVKSEKYSEAQLCKPNFSGLIPHPTDCTKFVNCALGTSFVQDCGPGTAFNSVIQSCDHPHKVGCEISSDKDDYILDPNYIRSPVNSHLNYGFQPGQPSDHNQFVDQNVIRVYDQNVVSPQKQFFGNCGTNCASSHHQPISGQNCGSNNCGPGQNGQSSSGSSHKFQGQTGQNCGTNCASSHQNGQPISGQGPSNGQNYGQPIGKPISGHTGPSNGQNYGQPIGQPISGHTGTTQGWNYLGQNCGSSNCQTGQAQTGEIQPGIQQPCRSDCGNVQPIGQNSGQFPQGQVAQNCGPSCQQSGQNCGPNCNQNIKPESRSVNLTTTYWAGQNGGQHYNQNSRAHSYDQIHTSGQSSRAHSVQYPQHQTTTNLDQTSSGSRQYYLHSRPNGQNTGSSGQIRPLSGQNIQTHSSVTEVKCPSGHSGLLPHPFICEKFLNCANGITFVQDCGAGTVFNPNSKICDWPYNVKCTSRTVDDKRETTGQNTGQYYGQTTQNYGQGTNNYGQNTGQQYGHTIQRNTTRYGHNMGHNSLSNTGTNYGHNTGKYGQNTATHTHTVGQNTGSTYGQNTGTYVQNTGHTSTSPLHGSSHTASQNTGTYGQNTRQTVTHTISQTGHQIPNQNTGQTTDQIYSSSSHTSGQNYGQTHGQNTSKYGQNTGTYGQNTGQTVSHTISQTGHQIPNQNTGQTTDQIYSSSSHTGGQNYGQTHGQNTGKYGQNTGTYGHNTGQTVSHTISHTGHQIPNQNTGQSTGQIHSSSAQNYGQTHGQNTGKYGQNTGESSTTISQTNSHTGSQNHGYTRPHNTNINGQNRGQNYDQTSDQTQTYFNGQHGSNTRYNQTAYTRIIGYRREPPLPRNQNLPSQTTNENIRPIYHRNTTQQTKFSPIEPLEPVVLNSTIKVEQNTRKTGNHWPPPFPSTDTDADYYFEEVTEASQNKGGKKVWKNAKSCKEGEFECGFNECIPNIWHCDGEEDCSNGLDEKDCKMHLKKFNTIPNSRLYKHEVEKWLNTDLETCANYCLNSKSFTCKSFNFRKNENVCLLCDTNVGLSGALANSKLYDYYEISAYAVNCSTMYKCSNSKCINYKQICDGNDDCGNKEDEKNCSAESIGYQIKLAGSPFKNEGRIEVKVFDEWGYICDDKFGLRNADVVCKELGFKEGALELKSGSYFARDVKENETFYLMDDVQCIGNETTIRNCDFNGWGTHNCMPQEIVGVVCKTPSESCPVDHWKCDTTKECLPLQFLCDGVVDCFDRSDEGIQHCEAPIEVRLVNGTSRNEGRVEVRYHGVWGTICDDDFNDMTARVVCSSLGFHGSAVAKKDGAFGAGVGPIWLDQVNCYGNESTVQDCAHWNWGEHNCEHSEDAGVVCSHLDSTQYEKKSKDKDIINITPIKPNIDETIFKGKCGFRGDDLFTDENNENSDIHFRVVKGTLARRGDYPWQATIRVKGMHKSSHWCGAIVISNKYVLTAAHCLVGFSKGAYIVRAGDYNVDEEEGTEVEAFIEDFFVHERFRQGGHMNNDIALIKLKGNGLKLSKQVQPICLPNKDAKYKTGLNCTISGFGSTETGKSSSSRQLRAGWVTLQSEETCKMPQVYGDAITEGMFCAGSLDEGVDSCDGDSGGPLACLDKGLFTLYGITSWGQRCGHVNKPGVYVKVAEYRDWIDRIIEETS